MKSKTLFIILSLLAASLQAEDINRKTGVTTEFNAEEKTISVDHTVYELADSARIHRLSQRGEHGPSIPNGKVIEFITGTSGAITEMWILN